MYRILLVEDDDNLALALCDGFEHEGHSVLLARDGAAAVDMATAGVDLIILDLMLPKMSGYEVCDQLRKKGNNTPLIILSVRSHEKDKVLGLNMGADDYVTKPFSFVELTARIESLMRRTARQTEGDICQFGDLIIDLNHERVMKAGKSLSFSAMEYQILRHLVEHRGEVVSRDQLLRKVWGYEAFPSTRTVDVHIAKLRKKIEDDPNNPDHIATVHGAGYKFLP
jgi:two-component system, OmpR family, alkaline phosphatase synthesis response regulator PhoP